MDQKELLHFPKRALFVVNPVAGRKTIQKHLSDCVRALMDAGYLVTTMVTAERGEATQYAKTYGKFYDLVVCAGGDGTLNETVTGLAKSHTNVTVGYIPCGTTNDFSASHGLPKDIPGAMQGIVSGQRQRYDACCFADQYFVGVALFGAFSWMAYTTDQTRKNMLGLTAYVLDAAKELPHLKPRFMRVEIDGKMFEDDYLVGAVCNCTSVLGIVELPEGYADTCDGMLEVFLIRFPRTLPELESIVRSLVFGTFSSPMITLAQGKRITVSCDEPCIWSLDGESSCEITKAEISAVPGFLQMKI
jgi:YegS/Rv2252/BmrU family lipid kinase